MCSASRSFAGQSLAIKLIEELQVSLFAGECKLCGVYTGDGLFAVRRKMSDGLFAIRENTTL